MTSLSRLNSRLKRISGKVPQQPFSKPDLSYLSGRQLDRIRQIGKIFSETSERDEKLVDELRIMLAQCPVLGTGEILEIRPRFPRSLIRYWRRLAFEHHELPRGNYYSHNLSYHARDRLWELAEKYGWRPETDEPNDIADLDEWILADYEELIDILSSTISSFERNSNCA